MKRVHLLLKLASVSICGLTVRLLIISTHTVVSHFGYSCIVVVACLGILHASIVRVLDEGMCDARLGLARMRDFVGLKELV